MVYIYLNDLELWALWELAQRRQSAKAKDATDKRSDKSIDNTEMHYIGLKGEYAVSKHLKIPMDMSMLAYGAPWGDLVYREKTIEVKVLQRHLIFTPGTFTAEIAVLVLPYKGERDRRVNKKQHAYKHVRIAGWTTREFFDAHKINYDFGYGDRWMMKQHLLYDMEKLTNGSFLHG